VNGLLTYKLYYPKVGSAASNKRTELCGSEFLQRITNRRIAQHSWVCRGNSSRQQGMTSHLFLVGKAAGWRRGEGRMPILRPLLSTTFPCPSLHWHPPATFFLCPTLPRIGSRVDCSFGKWDEPSQPHTWLFTSLFSWTSFVLLRIRVTC